MGGVSIRIGGLELRGLDPKDVDALLEQRADRRASASASWKPRDREDALAFIDLATRFFDTEGCKYLLGAYRDGRLAGDLLLEFQGPANAIVEIDAVFPRRSGALRDAAWALRALLGFLFESRGKRRVFARTSPRDRRGGLVYAGAGMKREGLLRKSLLVDGEWRDAAVYAILRETWKRNWGA
jgi:ribosomal-protein-alanine N-acetyltransferase